MVHTGKMCQQETQSCLFLFYVLSVLKGHTHIWSEKSESLNCKRMGSGFRLSKKGSLFLAGTDKIMS